jgi:cytochrome c556
MRTGNVMIGAVVKSKKDYLFNEKQIRIEKKMLSEIRRKLRMAENRNPFSQNVLKEQAKLFTNSIKKLNKQNTFSKFK